MLLQYSFSNFQSFREKTVVSLRQSKKATESGWDRTSPAGVRFSTILAVFGANAAGKTALLKPLAFMSWFIRDSFSSKADDEVAITTHFDSTDPSEFEVEAEDDEGVTWRYELVASRARVYREALHRKTGTRYSYLFIREWNEAEKLYDVKQQNFGLAHAEARKVRQNASLISTAAQYGVAVAKEFSDFAWIQTNVCQFGRRAYSDIFRVDPGDLLGKHPDVLETIAKILKGWDLGISDIRAKSERVTRTDGETADHWQLFGVHKLKSGREFELPMESESSGTQSALVLLSCFMIVLAQGGVALIDELESDIHPLLLTQVLEIFASRRSNPKNAQLVFTCHSTPMLDTLNKTQVMFVEKEGCESHAYRGDEIEGLRSDDNLRAKYESGALGSVPNT